MKRFIIIASLIVSIQTTFAADFSAVSPSGHTLYYNIVDPSNHIVSVTYPGTQYGRWTGYTMPIGNVELPGTVIYGGTNYTVTKIRDYTFAGCTGISGLTLPNTLLEIEQYAFQSCTNIVSLTLPSSLVAIQGYAFYSCSKLASVSFPSALVSIGAYAFSGCKLTNVTIPNGVEWIGTNAFYSNPMSTVTVANSVEYIGTNAFQGGTWLNQQPNGMVYLGKVAYTYKGNIPSNYNLSFNTDTKCITADFSNNSNIVSLTLPDSLLYIVGSFYGCGNITQVTIPNFVRKIESNRTFAQCGSLTTVNYNAINATVAGSQYYNTYNPFAGCENFTTVNIGNFVQVIPDYIFSGCTHVTTVNMSTSVIKIGKGAFANTGITTFTIPTSVDTIDSSPFSGCTFLHTLYYNAVNCRYVSDLNVGITNIVFGNNVQVIPNSLCSNMTSLQGNLTLPNSLLRIGNSAFYGCTGLTGSLVLPNNLQYIGSYAFNGCSGFSGSISIPNNTVYVGSGAFNDCHGITSLIIGHNVDTMTTAFQNMANLQSITYNAANCSRASLAFSNDTNVTAFNIGNSVRKIPEMTIYGLYNITAITLPEGLTHIGPNNFSSIGISGDIIIPSTLVEMGYGAFTSCPGIDRVICNAVNPPAVPSLYGNSYIFSGSFTKPLLVPCESVNAYRNAAGWEHFTNINGIGNCGYTISALSGTPSGGYVEGGGVYNEGEQCSLSAIAYNGYRFDHWDDYSTQNPRTFIVTEDATFIAYFVATQGIDDMIADAVNVYTFGGQIVVVTELKDEISIYDIVGRKVDCGHKTRFDVPASGVYLVKIGSLPTQKVVVVK